MTEQTRPTGHVRWIICALLFFATTVNYVDRQILSFLKPMMVEQWGWSNTAFGWVNSAFQLAYALGMLVFGWFIDRYGEKLGYAASIAAWSVAAISHAAVSTVTGFGAARVFLGLGESGNFPSAIKAVANWFPKKERALATSIFNSGTNVGAIIAPAVVPFVVVTWGWQAMFIIAGAAGFVWLLFWIPFYDVPERRKGVSKAELDHILSDGEQEGAGKPVPWKTLLKYRQTWSFAVAKGLTDPVWWFFLIWLPGYFKETRGLDITKSWLHLVTIYAIVTVLSIMGGWLTGYFAGRGWSISRARKTSMAIFALTVTPIFFATQVGDWAAVLLIGLAGASHQAWSANLFTTSSDMFPKRAVASMTSIGGMAGALGGFMFPILTGMLLDKFKAAGNVNGGYAILFAFCAFIYMIAWVLNHLLAPKFDPVVITD
jgi:MFS transporter, ACS family, hexuronate transporter